MTIKLKIVTKYKILPYLNPLAKKLFTLILETYKLATTSTSVLMISALARYEKWTRFNLRVRIVEKLAPQEHVYRSVRDMSSCFFRAALPWKIRLQWWHTSGWCRFWTSKMLKTHGIPWYVSWDHVYLWKYGRIWCTDDVEPILRKFCW